MTWDRVSEREREFVIMRLEVLRADKLKEAWRAESRGNDFERCKAELYALNAAIELLIDVRGEK